MILSGYVLRFEYLERRLSHGAAVGNTNKEIKGQGCVLRTVVGDEKGNSTHCLDTCYRSSAAE